MASKNVALSKTNQLGAGVVILAGFKIYQAYYTGGIGAIDEADVMLVITGLGIIINRIKCKVHKELHFKKPKVDTL